MEKGQGIISCSFSFFISYKVLGIGYWFFRNFSFFILYAPEEPYIGSEQTQTKRTRSGGALYL